MLKRKLVSIWVITTVVLTLVGCDSRSNTSSIAPIVPAVQVETQPIKSRTIIQQVTGYGVVKSHNVVALKCLQTNKITAILFNAGQTVTKGQVLVQLDPQVAKAKVAHDQALLVATQQAWQRQARLSTKGLISRSVYDDSAIKIKVY